MATIIDLSEQSDADSSENDLDGEEEASGLDGVRMQIGQEVAGQLWHAGRQSTQNFINMYAHIDFLRPYFDVEPKQVRNRLLYSFIPSRVLGAPQEATSELYGPLMLTLSLVAVLLYGMKSSGHEVEEGTLIGTAMAVCFGYWLGISSVMFFIAYLFNAHFGFVQIVSLTGYSLCGHCTVLLLSTLFDHNGHPHLFYLLWVLFGGLSAFKMVGVYVSRTWSMRDGAILGGLATMFHMLFLLYLRWEYHKIYEALAEVL